MTGTLGPEGSLIGSTELTELTELTGRTEPSAEAAGPSGDAEQVPDVIALVSRLHAGLRRRRQTVAVAESLTGGLLAAALSEIPGSSTGFRGGLVVYATDLKAQLAGVSEQLLAERGAVDPQVALELARGVRARLSASWGIGITGVAGPDPQDGKPVGTVYVAVVGPRESGETVSELELSGSRKQIRDRSVMEAVRLLLRVVEDLR